jgi:predicted Holliday junction resolvase-like endonuclease
MGVPNRVGVVMPRPRIPNVLGILNIVVATCLLLFGSYVGVYFAIIPMSQRAMTEMREKGEADLEAKKQVELKAIEVAARAAKTEDEKKAVEARRKAVENSPKVILPVGMDIDKMGLNRSEFRVFSWAEVVTGFVLNVLLLVSGIELVRRHSWGIRLGLATAAAKIVRLVLAYGYVALVLIPPLAQATGRMAFEAVAQQNPGGKTPPGLDPAFLTKIYYVSYTVIAVSMIVFGSIYPMIVLWFLSRPGARAACDDRARRDRDLGAPRVVGSLNVIFGTFLILFGTCLGLYLTALPIIGRSLVQVQKKAEAGQAAQQRRALKALDEDLKKATTEEEKHEIEEQRTAIENQAPVVIAGSMDLSQLGFSHPKVRTYYWIDLTTGLILNMAMIVAGIGLLRRKPWGITLGIGTAAAKIVRLVVLYSYFAFAISGVFGQQSAELVARSMVQKRSMSGPPPPKIDAGPLLRVYEQLYTVVPFIAIVMGSIYPAITVGLLTRARAQLVSKEKPLSGVEEEHPL